MATKLTPEQLITLRGLVLPYLDAARNAEATARAITGGFLAALGINDGANLNLDTGEIAEQESST